MPGSVSGRSGVQDRPLGRSVFPASALQHLGKGGGLMAGGGNIFVGVSAAGAGNAADTTEDTLFTVTLPPGSLDIVGRQIYIEAFGSVTATNATKTARVRFGSTLLAAFAWATTTLGIWALQAIITKAGANSQIAIIQPDQVVTGTNTRLPTTASMTEADTAGIVISATGQSTVATANTVTCNLLCVSGYN
jgi:hypothetical protein